MRVSTDQQSTARQSLVLEEAGIEGPVVFEDDPGTPSRLHPLQGPNFRELLTHSRPGDTVRISEMFRLAPGTGHILDVLRGELQPDLQRELTYDGLRAAEAKGSKGGCRPAVPAAKADTVRTAYREGRSIAPLTRDDGFSRGAIRTAVADLMPDHAAIEQEGGVPSSELPVTLDVPDRAAVSSARATWSPQERDALDQGVTVRRGQGRTLRVTAAPAVHRQLLARRRPLDGGQGLPAVPARRKVRREYGNRLNAHVATAGP
ncbi:recombinase family protein [Streptomyces sp. NPDC019531]|uniref:recombinase family protein n=1 Tax=Streptomyces sp. NPDC019531 TaxID=3365062 RepID=UPI0038509423